MKLFFTSTRNGETSLSSYEGMDRQKVLELMAGLGHTAISELTEVAYKQQVNALNQDS